MRNSWARIVTYFVAFLVVLAAPLYTASIAEAAATTTSVASNVSGGGHVKVIKRSHPPKRVHVTESVGQRGSILNGTTQSLSTDWSWWHGGWTVKFNRTETNRMAFAFGACTTVVGAFLPAPWAIGLYAICGAVAIAAGWASVNGKCLTAWVPLSLTGITLYQRTC